MAWVRLDDDFYLHPKLVRAGPLALAMQVAALCYSNHYRTRGFIPHSVADRLLDLSDYATISEANDAGDRHVSAWRIVANDLADALVDAGSWIVNEERGGYDIHDYDKYQPEVKQDELREKRAEAGRAGGLAKARNAASKEPSETKQSLAKSSPVPVPVPVPDLAISSTTTTLPRAAVPVVVSEVHKRAYKAFMDQSPGGLIPYAIQEIDGWIQDGIPVEWIEGACAEAADKGGRKPIAYIRPMIERWRDEGSMQRGPKPKEQPGVHTAEEFAGFGRPNG